VFAALEEARTDRSDLPSTELGEPERQTQPQGT